MTVLQLSLGELIPILPLSEPELLAEPQEVAPAVGTVLPKPPRDLSEPPLQPLVVRLIVLEDGERGTPEPIEQPSAAIGRKGLPRNPIPVFTVGDP